MATQALLMVGAILLSLVAAAGATGAGMSVEASTCIQDAELRLRPDGNVYACRVSRQINASVGPEAKNRNVVCAAGSYVEFHYNGHLAYCDKLAKASSYLIGDGGASSAGSKNQFLSMSMGIWSTAARCLSLPWLRSLPMASHGASARPLCHEQPG